MGSRAPSQRPHHSGPASAGERHSGVHACGDFCQPERSDDQKCQPCDSSPRCHPQQGISPRVPFTSQYSTSCTFQAFLCRKLFFSWLFKRTQNMRNLSLLSSAALSVGFPGRSLCPQPGEVAQDRRSGRQAFSGRLTKPPPGRQGEGKCARRAIIPRCHGSRWTAGVETSRHRGRPDRQGHRAGVPRCGRWGLGLVESPVKGLWSTCGH